MITIRQVKLPVNHTEADLVKKIKKELNIEFIFKKRTVKSFEYSIIRKSLDARKKPELFYIYAVETSFDYEDELLIKKFFNKYPKKSSNISFEERVKFKISDNGNSILKKRPIVIGDGPCGLFCAYVLALSGMKPLVIERGQDVNNRLEAVERCFTTGIVNPDSNVQFGEGGAGTFSDGKLNTLTKDSTGMHRFVLETFHEFGADEEITYLAKPHIGTDKLTGIIKNIRERIIELNGTFLFETKMTDVVLNDNKITGVIVEDANGIHKIECDVCVLAIGHSARDTFMMLKSMNINMQSKDFAVGFRVSHKQSMINESQYGIAKAEGLGAADYKLANTTDKGKRVYSFCMCPGGYVVNASSEVGRMCVNGMSYSDRASEYANSAIVVAVGKDDFDPNNEYDNDDPLIGMYYQRKIEEKAYNIGGGFGCIPMQRFEDFENNRVSFETGDIKPLSKGMCMNANLREILSEDLNEAIIESIHKFGYTLKGFDSKDALMYGIEARTSSPIRIVRDDEFESNIKGLYPAGEGAGYAGGITSAAVDGVRIANKIVSKYRPIY